MNSIEIIRNINKNYDEEVQKLDVLNTKVRAANDDLDLEEVKSKLTYLEAKDLYKLILSRSNNKEKCEEFKKIVDDKKIKEYPQINDVHYYPIINDMNFLEKEKRIKLDILIKDAYRNRNIRENLNNLDTNILDFLVENSILEKIYIFHCNCHSIECEDKIITQDRFDKLKKYWEKSYNDETTPEEDQEMRYGCFETGCWHGDSVEVCSLEDFNEHLRRIEYKVIKEPDLTLDKL